MAEERKARAVGFNHVALEVGDIEEALAFYGRLFEFKLALVDISGAKALVATAVSESEKSPDFAEEHGCGVSKSTFTAKE